MNYVSRDNDNYKWHVVTLRIDRPELMQASDSFKALIDFESNLSDGADSIKALFRLEMKIFWVSHRMCRKDVGMSF